MIYARVVVFSFLFVALYILRYYSLFCFALPCSLAVLLSVCVCVCDFFLFRRGMCVSAISWLAPWVSRSIDRSFDRLIDSSVGGSRVTLSSFLSWCPLSLNYLYICILCSQSSHLKFWYISHSFFLDFGLFIIFFCFLFRSSYVAGVSLIGSRSRFAEDCPRMRLPHDHL